MLKFIVRRLVFAVITFIVITALLYGVLMLAPVEARAMLYLPKGDRAGSFNLLQGVIEKHRLDDPYPIQYVRWLIRLLQGDWGWSPSMRDDVLAAFLRRTPVTAELTLFSVLLFIPLGIASGVIAGWKQGRPADYGFRLIAFVATSIPSFILGLMLLAIFYVGLKWFPAGRISISNELIVDSSAFKSFTGLLVVDSLLNGRSDIALDAVRHLVLPVITLSLAHWATLGRVTRAAMIEELTKDYIVVARGKGLSRRLAVWRHALRNAMVPALNSSALSAATVVTGVFIIETIFALPGVSEPLSGSTVYTFGSLVPDIPATMGFAVYGILLVLPLMLVLDFMQALIDPRIREGGLT
jgi:peptide/nickel transport system permease protein